MRRRRYPGGRVGLEAGSGVEGAPGMGVFLGGCEARRYPSPGGAGRGNRRPGRGEHRLSGCRDGGSPGGDHQPRGTPNPGYPQPRVVPPPGSLPPQVAPFPGYFHAFSIPIPGLSPFPAYLPARGIPHPGLSPSPGPPPPRGAALPQDGWAGGGRAGSKMAGSSPASSTRPCPSRGEGSCLLMQLILLPTDRQDRDPSPVGVPGPRRMRVRGRWGGAGAQPGCA